MPLAIVLALLAIWAIVTTILPLVDPVIVPAPLAVVRAGIDLFVNDAAAVHIGVTLRRLCIALALSIAIGVPLGLFLGYRRAAYEAIEGLVHALRSIPATALFPLLLIVVGVGEASIVTVATYPGVLIVLVNAASGAMLADRSRLRQGRVLGMSSWQIVTKVLFFEALPLIFGGVRTVVSYALVLVVAIEMFVGIGRYGLGRLIFDLQSSYRIPESYAAVAVTGVVGITLNLLLNRIERHILRWQPALRGSRQ
jgi:ABC-type nitrate/sulfonate/bicarbonate transport system permease component